MPFHLHENRKKTQASIPDDDFLRASFDDFRIYQRPRFCAGQLQKYNALRDADLRRGDASAVAGGGSPVRQRVGEVFHQSARFPAREDSPRAWRSRAISDRPIAARFEWPSVPSRCRCRTRVKSSPDSPRSATQVAPDIFDTPHLRLPAHTNRIWRRDRIQCAVHGCNPRTVPREPAPVALRVALPCDEHSTTRRAVARARDHHGASPVR